MKYVKYIWIPLAIISIGILFSFMIPNQTKIAYIKNVVVMEKYLGMLDGKKEYDLKMGQWQANIDTLKLDLQRNINAYNAQFNSLSENEKSINEQLIRRQQNDLKNYANTIEEKAAVKDQEIMQGVLNQINACVEQYARDNGYDFVFGTTINGNIMYAGDAYDITDQIIEELNNEYKHGK